MSSIVGVGITTAFASLMTEYQFPIRLITLAILEWSFVSINRAINNNSTGNISYYSNLTMIIKQTAKISKSKIRKNIRFYIIIKRLTIPYTC